MQVFNILQEPKLWVPCFEILEGLEIFEMCFGARYNLL